MASKGGKLGENWTYKIYFDPKADESSGLAHIIEDEELVSEFEDLVDADEQITEVSAYKSPLIKVQLTKFLLFHMFVIFETEKWWWSIEKQGDGITIQRSKKIEAVKYRYRQDDRLPGIELMESRNGNMSVHDLVEWLYQTNELNKKYNYLTSNCQHFAKAVFNHVADQKVF